eukprot:6490753-Amphidinium_carterae.6
MNEDYVEEKHIGKTIIDGFFTKTRLNEKQSAHRLYNNNNNNNNNNNYNNNNEQRQVPLDLDKTALHADEHPTQAEDNSTTKS